VGVTLEGVTLMSDPKDIVSRGTHIRMSARLAYTFMSTAWPGVKYNDSLSLKCVRAKNVQVFGTMAQLQHEEICCCFRDNHLRRGDGQVMYEAYDNDSESTEEMGLGSNSDDRDLDIDSAESEDSGQSDHMDRPQSRDEYHPQYDVWIRRHPQYDTWRSHSMCDDSFAVAYAALPTKKPADRQSCVNPFHVVWGRGKGRHQGTRKNQLCRVSTGYCEKCRLFDARQKLVVEQADAARGVCRDHRHNGGRRRERRSGRDIHSR
jgi:hypothetical protein